MKFKNLFSAVSFITMSFIATAQTTITNGNMESWTGSGATVRPAQWHSTKSDMSGNSTATGAAPQTIWDSTIAPHGGSNCAYLKSGSVIGTTVNGALTTGRIWAPTFTASDGYIKGDPSDYDMPFTGRPDSLIFWMKYQASGSSDYGTVEARIHTGVAYAPDNCYGGTNTTVVARALYASAANSPISSWTRLSIPFVYDASYGTNNPAYILVSCSASAPTSTGSATSGSQMWLDDFDVIYNPKVTNVASISPTTYSVTNTTSSAITVPFTFAGTNVAGATLTAQLSNASGSFASPTLLGTVTDNFTRTTTGTAPAYSGTIAGTIPAATATGTYKVRIISNQQSWISDTATITVNLTNCGNTVTPSSQQNLLTNQSGTALTVAASFTVDSNSWYYGTSIGSYTTSLGNTTTTYTPQFASAGTYYVVCKSTSVSCGTITSSPVTVVVSAPAPTITTNDVNPLSYNLSAHANTQIIVPFTSSGTFNAGNVFTVDISDQTGSFAIPGQTYTTAATTSTSPIVFQLSNSLAVGTQYLVRVSSSNPAIVGTPNTTAFAINQFSNVVTTVTPTDTQYTASGQPGGLLTVSETQIATHEWKWSTSNLDLSFNSFPTAETNATYTPIFTTPGTRYIKAISINDVPDTVKSNVIVVITVTPSGINDITKSNIKIYESGNDLMIETDNNFEGTSNFALYAISGQEVLRGTIKQGKTALSTQNLSAGVYAFRLGEYSGKIVIQ